MAFITNLLKSIFIPILEKIGRLFIGWVADLLEKRRIKKDQDRKTKAIKDAKTSEEHRAAHRNNERI